MVHWAVAKIHLNVANCLFGLCRLLHSKSHLMRQIEKYPRSNLPPSPTASLDTTLRLARYADIYTSRISNLLAYTAYFRFTASPQSLQHDVPHAHLKVRSAATGSGDIPRVSPRSET